MTRYLLVMASLVVMIPSAWAESGRAQLPNERAARLRDMVGRAVRLQSSGLVKGYVSSFAAKPMLFKVQRRGALVSPPDWAVKTGASDYRGASLVMTVERGSSGEGMRAWFNSIGKESIGLGTRSYPGMPKDVLGTMIRIGEDWFFYKAVRGDVEPDETGKMIAYTPQSILQRDKPLTEATFLASPAEMKAVKAFILARHHKLFKREDGTAILPAWKHTSAPGNFNAESCAQACTSFMDEKWLDAYRRIIPQLKQDPRFRGLIADNTIDVLRGFASRIGLVRFTGFKEPIRRQLHTADAITVFNTGMADPLRDLSWSRFNGLTPPVAPLDVQPGKTCNGVSCQRMSLRDFQRGL
jgi:hypothetical protein